MTPCFVWVRLPVVFALLLCLPAHAESHRATRLGNPATRFAAPLYTPDDLRARFRDPRLQMDIATVLQLWGWNGNTNDLFAAAASANIADIKIPVGTVMPFMSSREGGRPMCLRNVTWAGAEPAPAYAFNFSSRGRSYRCVTPKACSNFFLEDLGAEPKPALAIDCNAPGKVFVGQKIDACLVLRNTGNVAAPRITVSLPVPADTVVVDASAGGSVANDSVTWEIVDVAAGATNQVCARFKTQRPGTVSFRPAASSPAFPAAQSACETAVAGVSALLLETADDPDPVSIGGNTAYTVRVTNQGTADDTNVKMIVEFPAEIDPVSASNAGVVSGKTVTFPAFPRLAPKAAFEYSIIAKGIAAGDARVKFIRTSDDIPAPTMAEESTRVY